MKGFRLVKGVVADAIADEVDPRRKRILIALEELRAIKSPQELRKAKARGVELSLEGVRARAKVGTETLRVKYDDLFQQINPILDFIYKDVLGIQRGAKGRPRTAKAARRQSDLEKKVAELEMLVDRRERDFQDLLEELRLARAN